MKIDHLIPPVATVKPTILLTHGDQRIDSYYWLNNRDDKEVIDYLETENEYTRNILAPFEPLENKMYEEIISRIQKNDSSVPFFLNDYYYQIRYAESLQYPSIFRSKTEDFKEEVLLIDENILAEGFAYYQLSSFNPSNCNHFLVYSEDTVSRRLYDLKLLDIDKGELKSDLIKHTNGECIWSADNLYFFYVKKDVETLRDYCVCRHKIGTSESEDVEIYTERDETFYISISKSRSNKFLIIHSSQTISNEDLYLNLDTPLESPKVFTKRQLNIEYQIDHFDGKFYILTNYEAENFCLMSCEEDHTSKDNWTMVIPADKHILLEQCLHFIDCLVVAQRQNGLTQIKIIPRNEEDSHLLEFHENAYLASIGMNPDYHLPYVRIQYQSMSTPSTVYDYDWKEKKLTFKKQQTIVGDFKSENYHSERIFVPGKDGTLIPMSMVYKKDLGVPANHPLLLYAYGSYGISLDPYFSSARLSLLDRGFIYVIAHIRGGEELGRHWYNSGKLLNKKNTFFDFISCAEWLINNNYTSADKCFAMGGSAGGLLMGAVLNMAPQLWKGVIAAVPFVDVVTTMLDDTIPLTTFEYDEWGNPSDPVYYHYMKSYSPVDNVRKMEYPAILVTTGLHDSQVQYWEPAKWVAKLRAYKTDQHVLLLRTNMDTGHSGATGRFAQHKETAMEYTFLISLLENEII
jgi:oligopeptidase B